MSKEQAMQEYLDEIRKVRQSSTMFGWNISFQIIATMTQTDEVVEFARSMGFVSAIEDNPVKETDTVIIEKNLEREIAEASQPISTSDSAELIDIPEKDSDTSSLSSSSISSSGKSFIDLLLLINQSL